MSWVEWIGFLISVTFLLFLLLRGVWETRQRNQNPEEYYKEQRLKQKRYKEFLKSMEIDVEDDFEQDEEEEIEERHIPPAPKSNGRVPAFIKPSPVITPRTPFAPTAMQQPTVQPLSTKPESEVAKGKIVISQLKSKKAMIILHAIVGRPKSDLM